MRKWVRLALSLAILSLPVIAPAFTITDNLEAITIPALNTTFQTVTFAQSYTDPVVICSGSTANQNNFLPIVRINNLTSTSMSVRVQKFTDDDSNDNPTVDVNTVYCIVSDAGTHTVGADGVTYTAGKVNVSGENWNGNWNSNETVQAVTFVVSPAQRPGVLSQVMSYNDSTPHVSYVTGCGARTGLPFTGAIFPRLCVGRNTAGYNIDLAAETVGYIYFQEGSGVITSNRGTAIQYIASQTSENVRGVKNFPPYDFPTTYQLEVAVASQNAMQGVNGGFIGLYGSDPLAGTQIGLAQEESDNQDRSHTTEFASFFGFAELTPEIEVLKTVDIEQTAAFDLLDYEIEVTNSGEASFNGISLDDVIAQDTTTLTLTSGPVFFAPSDVGNDGVLDIGETWQYSATYQLSDDNFDDGNDVVNTVSATATIAASNTDITPVETSATTVLIANPLLNVVKTAELQSGGAIPAGGVSAQTAVTYRYTIRNTGNVAITNVIVTDDHRGSGALSFANCSFPTDLDDDSVWGGMDFSIARIGAGDIADCTADYLVTQEDIDAQ